MPSQTIPPHLAAFQTAPPHSPVDLLFIHHSVGGQWLADPGPLENTEDARRSLHRTHPNGGGLRALLESQGYRVHEASYGSEIGQKTDLFDWLPKFRDQMPRVLSTRWQDETLDSGTNRVVVFKSCYPNNAFRPDGAEAGQGMALTVANAKSAFESLRAELARHPGVLFVYVTAPPLRDDSASEPRWKSQAKRLLGRPSLRDQRHRAADAARAFNDWVTSPTGWLGDGAPRNIVPFDYFGLLSDGDLLEDSAAAAHHDARPNFLRYASNGGTDNHPHAEAQRAAARHFVSLLNRAVHYAGLA